jgi:hypothetical protein
VLVAGRTLTMHQLTFILSLLYSNTIEMPFHFTTHFQIVLGPVFLGDQVGGKPEYGSLF